MRRPATVGPVEPGARRRRFGPDRGGRAAVDGGAAAAAAGAAAATAHLIARVLALIAWLVVLVIAAGIVMVVLKANMGNSVVSSIHDAARFLAGPFDGIFKPHDGKLAVAINWGLAAVVYLVIARF